jgi:hypothetical protein
MTWGAVAGATITAAAGAASSAGASSGGSVSKPVSPPQQKNAANAMMYFAGQGLQPNLNFTERLDLQGSQDALKNEQLIAKEQMLRDMGRYPGVVGPEKYDQYRRLQDAQIMASSKNEAMFRIERRKQAQAMLQTLASQSQGQESQTTNPEASGAAGMGEAGGFLASMLNKGQAPAPPAASPASSNTAQAAALYNTGNFKLTAQ